MMKRRLPRVIRTWQRKGREEREESEEAPIPSDVQGSYTGTPLEEGDDRPVQDADDLLAHTGGTY